MNHSHMLFSGHLRLTFIAVLKFYRLIQLLSSEVPFTSSRSSCGNPGTETFHFKSGVTVCSPAPPAAGSRAGRDRGLSGGRSAAQMFQVTHTFLAARASPSVSWGSSTVSTRQERAASSAAPSAPCLPFSLPVSTKWAHRSGQLIFIYSPKAPCAQDSSEGSPDFIFNFTSQRCIIMLFRHSEKLNKSSVNGRALSTKIPKLTFYTVWSHGQPPVFSSTGAPAITRWYGGVHEAPLP